MVRHETTSSSVTWALYLLSTYPDVQDKLRHELQSLDFDNSPNFEQVESLKYLNNVCREVLRFIPPGTNPEYAFLIYSDNDYPPSR
jgi:cytochrome P450